jgi:pimeloyl-ACP methyl ester carboxylesterase
VLIITVIVILFLSFGMIMPSKNPVEKSTNDRYIEIQGSRIRYKLVSRGGPAIIFLHGFGQSCDIWDEITLYLEMGEMFSYDLIGFAGSSRPAINYDLETQRKYLIAFLDVLKLERAVIIGISMGASLAAWTAAHSPDRVKALVLSAPSGYPGSLTYPWPLSFFYRPGKLNRLARKVAGSRIFEFSFPNSLARQALDITYSYNSSFGEALSRIQQPVLLFWSSGDRRVPFTFSHHYRERISQIKFIELEAEAGHGGITSNPRKAAEKIYTFLKEVAR